jgi:microcin C transport system permease protein
MRSVLADLVLVVLAVALGFLLTTQVIPRATLFLLRILGFNTQASPVTLKRIARFKRIRRGYWSFLALTTIFVTSLFLELLVNGRPLVIHYGDRTAFPAIAEWASKAVFFADVAYFQRKSDFGQSGDDEVDYRRFALDAANPELVKSRLADDRKKLDEARATLKAAQDHNAELKAQGERVSVEDRMRVAALKNDAEQLETELAEREKTQGTFLSAHPWCVMPIYWYGPTDYRLDLPQSPPSNPSFASGAPLGTDEAGRDVLVLLLYGFRISLAYALVVWAVGYSIGTVIGALQGYFGSWTDIGLQRVEEIWSSIPYLYVIMIIASLVTPTFGKLVLLTVILSSWLGITFYMRAEFYREKAKDYVQAAIGSGVSDFRIMTRHILPNALVPIVTLSPFTIVGYVSSLVALDFLGFGLPPGTPSWGNLLEQGLENVLFHPHLIIAPSVALVLTLFSLVLVGEAVREAFDPKVFSRLR